MNPHLTQFIVEAHTAELTQRARQSRLARDARAGRGQPHRLRTTTARFLLALAARLDDRLQPAASPASTAAARS